MTSPAYAAGVAEALEALAARQPSAPLLHSPGYPSITYGNVATQIAYVRDRLRGWGIARGDVIAGFVASRPRMALACMALPSSSTFAPLSGSLKAAEYTTLLERLHATAVLVPEAADHPLRAAARALGLAELHAVDDPSAHPGMFTLDAEEFNLRRGVETLGSADFAYVVVTSGTTGRPKLVPMGHRQTLAFARTLNDWLQLTPSDVCCSLAPMHLAGGLRGTLLMSALSGGALVCLPVSDIEGFFAAIGDFRLTYLAAGFAIHRDILRRAMDFPDAVRASRFRFLRTSQGRLGPDEIARLEAIFRAPVLVGLGSSEAAGIAHDPLPPGRRKAAAVGVPMGGEVAIMDPDGRICPSGTVGEIVARGPLVFSGYFDDPELTARSFVGDWFRTGDAGRIDAEGFVHLDGRITEMINRGGEKISPLEIDAALESVRGVKEAAAFGVFHATLGEELVAAVVPHAGATLDEQSILKRLGAILDPRRVPRRIFIVDALPRTESRKIRRGELADRMDSAVTSRRANSASLSESPLEPALASLWAKWLRVDGVGRDDDFFLLGGDSLIGTQLLLSVQSLFGVGLPIRTLFETAATVAGMARAIESARGDAAGAGDPRELPR